MSSDVAIVKTKGVICISGPMKAGKSLLLYSTYVGLPKDEVFAITHTYNRYPDIKSRNNGETIPAAKVDNLMSIEPNQYLSKKYIIIDEAQFFPDLIDFVNLNRDKVHCMLIAGLDLTFAREPFGQIDQVVADQHIKLTANCDVCGQPAQYSARKNHNNKELIVIESDAYYSSCVVCFE